MSVHRQKKYFYFDFTIGGHRFHGSTRCTTRREAERFEALERDKARELIRTQRHAAQSIEIDHVAERYWQNVGRHHAGADTTERDLARLVQYFGESRLLSDITDADVIKLVAWRRGHSVKGAGERMIAPATVNRSTTEALKKLFTFAKREGTRFDREPHWKDHWLAEPIERVRELQQEEADSIDDALREDYAPLVAFARASGMRMNEVVTLRWSEVNFGNRRIIKTGKGGKLVSIPLTPTLRDILNPLRGQHDEFCFTYVARRTSKRAGTVKGHRYKVTLSGVKTLWRRMRAETGIVDLRFHDLRHDFASKLLRQTGNLKLVQRALNHGSIKTTLKYTHVLDAEVAAAMEAVAQDQAQPAPNFQQTDTKKTG